MTSCESSPVLAVEVKDAWLTYGRGPKAFHALRGVNLRVPEGVIYGLLGPSGCGKTTLLCSVVERRNLKHGQVKVFGLPPGTQGSQVPGRWIGFMPQELALYPEFTIEETLTYFGRLHRMDSDTLKERTEFLLKFLDLPKSNRLVTDLSGGQQRRVSFAAALIHRPPLLILDEPTVGVDPLLRQSIWDHLVKLTSTEGMTVIITTHYIEEARQANMVGLMRKGRLLAEDSPDALVKLFQVTTLEDCFLKLCLLDKDKKENHHESDLSEVIVEEVQTPEDNVTVTVLDSSRTSSEQESTSTTDLMTNETTDDFQSTRKTRKCKTQLNPGQTSGTTNAVVDCLVKTYALTAKNMIRLRRNLILVLFQFALPAIQVVLLCLCIGRPPFDLPVAVVNYEGTDGFGNLFLQTLDNDTLSMKYFVDTASALQSVKDGKTWGAIEIGPNFTSGLFQRYMMGLSADMATINDSTIRVFIDMTNQQIGVTLHSTLLHAFQDFVRDVFETYNLLPELAQLPVVMQEPVYGSAEPSFTEFIVPGVILAIIYIMAVGLTTLSFVEERKAGLFERSWISGVTCTQTLVSHIITQSVVLVFQVCGLLIFTFLVFQIPSRGPFILVILLVFLQGVVGMAYGLVISSLVSTESAALMIALGSFFPNLVASGIIWPVEGMHHVLRFMSYCLPQTLATEAMRAILGRGWDLSETVVWSGFLVTLAWICFLLIAAAAIFRIRK